MKATKNINIYLIDKKPVKVIDVVQYDTGIQLVFTVKDFSIPSEATATLYVQKPSGKFVYQTDGITISGDTVTINLDNQALTEHGKVPYQVTITSGSDTVTSFAGLMLVERKLNDAGATESKTVIKAFDELTADKLAELQTNAKTVIDALIATIPEDYTAMTAKVNESANAIKGSLSGAVIRADDVSPVEHLPVVKVHGKNLVNIDEVTIDNFTGYHHPISTGLKLQAGQTYTLSLTVSGAVEPFIVSIGTGATAYTKDVVYSRNLTNGRAIVTFTITQEDLTSGEYLYIRAPRYATSTTFSATISNIQLEHGDTATEYTPYIDPTTATVEDADGNTYTPNADGTVNGITSAMIEKGISTETSGMTIDVEYNKDTNKVISKLVNAISAMGGEVTI